MRVAHCDETNQPPKDACAGAYPNDPPADNLAPYPTGGGGAVGIDPPLPEIPTQWKGQVPDEDVHEDPNRQAEAPSVPPISMMERLPGYEDVGYQNRAFSPPPSYNEAMQMSKPRPTVTEIRPISQDVAVEALMQFASGYCCYGKNVALQSRNLEMKHSNTFHYTLETFTETRGTAWTCQPYNSQPVDEPFNGPAPGPWDMPASPSQKFTNTEQRFEVPHTASVKPCHNCKAKGYKRCHGCLGRGKNICRTCYGKGMRSTYAERHPHKSICHSCSGAGRKRCRTCIGTGRVVCGVCAGRVQLKWFIELTVKWENHVLEHVVERTALPVELIPNVSGKVAFEEEGIRVSAMTDFPDDSVNSTSQELVQKHSNCFPQSRVLLQRQCVRVVPVCQCQALFKDRPYQYFVYGFENRVYCPEYPQKCCCGCVML